MGQYLPLLFLATTRLKHSMLQLYAHCFVEELGKTKKEMVNLDWSDFE